MTDFPPETPDQRKARQFAQLRQIGHYAMTLAARAHTQAEHPEPTPEPTPDTDTVAHLRDCAAIVGTMSRAVRQTIAIEIRLDAPVRTRPAYRLSPIDRDPRRVLLTRVFTAAIARDPEAPRRRRRIIAHIQQHLEADPDQLEPMDETLATLCNELGIDLDPAHLPDGLLDFAPPDPDQNPDPQTDPPPGTDRPSPRAAPDH